VFTDARNTDVHAPIYPESSAEAVDQVLHRRGHGYFIFRTRTSVPGSSASKAVRRAGSVSP
jgi:hypothetical protein